MVGNISESPPVSVHRRVTKSHLRCLINLAEGRNPHAAIPVSGASYLILQGDAGSRSTVAVGPQSQEVRGGHTAKPIAPPGARAPVE